jgi:predicted nucleotidyltransferase
LLKWFGNKIILEKLTVTAQNILKTLGYFDLFQYPLTKEEICAFHAEVVSKASLQTALEILVRDKWVYRLDEFYSLQNDHVLAERRRKGNQLAAVQFKTARRVAKFLAAFPYVKGIAVSGSLSKNFATEKTDIDFFIVTTANRLWIARTCMHLYKKITFLSGRQHWFCMNYYVDEQEPVITEQNIFTAMEIVTLVPMHGKTSLDNFIAGNTWVRKYFPEQTCLTAGVPEIKSGHLRNLFEKIFKGRMGDRFDNWLMKLTQKRWHSKARKHALNSSGGSMGMIVGPHFSKPDPKNFQDKVVEAHRLKVEQLLQLPNKIASLVL